MSPVIELSAGDYRLVLEPDRGGSIARFDWRDRPLMRHTCGPSILDTACFPLVPFSNRIAYGRFEADGREVVLAPNMPGSDHPHPLHGFGWLTAWEVIDHAPDRAILLHHYQAGEWPWDYVAEQEYQLSSGGLRHSLSLRNQSGTPMPAGLGFHPYFPRTPETRYLGFHHGEWRTGHDGLPVALREAEEPVTWWRGAPVGSRAVDTVYTGRAGELTIIWPERDLILTIEPSDNLPYTVVFTPPSADFFCVEPVSHETDGINRPGSPGSMTMLAPGETMSVEVKYRVATHA